MVPEQPMLMMSPWAPIEVGFSGRIYLPGELSDKGLLIKPEVNIKILK